MQIHHHECETIDHRKVFVDVKRNGGPPRRALKIGNTTKNNGFRGERIDKIGM